MAHKAMSLHGKRRSPQILGRAPCLRHVGLMNSRKISQVEIQSAEIISRVCQRLELRLNVAQKFPDD